MHVERTGRGAPLVLLHGWAMHGGIFAPLAGCLAEHFELHLVDLPGHGHSRGRALALEDCADALARQLPPALWLGWSLGGLVALELALRHPDRVHGLVMQCASPRFTAAPDWPEGVAPAVLREFGTALAGDYAGTIERFLALEAFGSDHMRQELATLRAHAFARGEPDPRVLADGLALLESTDLRVRLPSLSMPSLWIAGRRDRLVPAAAMQQAAVLSGGRYLRIEGAGHAPFLSHAGRIADAVRAFAAAVSLEASAAG